MASPTDWTQGIEDIFLRYTKRLIWTSTPMKTELLTTLWEGKRIAYKMHLQHHYSAGFLPDQEHLIVAGMFQDSYNKYNEYVNTKKKKK